MKFQIRRSPDATDWVLYSPETQNSSSLRFIQEDCSVVVEEFDATNFDEAQTRYNKVMEDHLDANR